MRRILGDKGKMEADDVLWSPLKGRAEGITQEISTRGNIFS